MKMFRKKDLYVFKCEPQNVIYICKLKRPRRKLSISATGYIGFDCAAITSSDMTLQ